MKSFAHLRTADPGLNIDDTVMIATALRTDKYGSPAQREPFFAQLRERLRHLPGLQIEDFTNSFPLSDNQYFAVLFSIEGHSPAAQSTGRSFDYQTVSPEGLKSLGLRLTQGRMFTGRDTHTSTPVVILNQALARRYWPAENPIGERLIAPGDKFSREVVGIVSNGGAAEPNQPQMFVPAAQAHLPSRFVTVRAQVPLLGLTAEVHKAVKAIDRGIHISDLLKRQTDVTTDDRFLRAMLVMFAALGLLLAPLGLYGVLSFSVAQRTPEFGIRLALGAQARDVLKLVLRQGLKLALAGIMFGLGMAFMVSRVMSGMLFGVGNVDPLTLVVNAVLLTAVALLACWIPARRATKVDPMIALRTE